MIFRKKTDFSRSGEKKPRLWQALLPVVILVALLFVNVRYFDDALGGANQTVLLLAALVCGLLGWSNGVKWKTMRDKIIHTIHTALEPIIILLLIGALSGAWMISGIIPMMIYYGVSIMHPAFFLAAVVVICSVVSLATGSSWSTIATIGVAIIGIGNAFGMPHGLVAGAVISGAYFGDKMSPLSDTTNLAAAVGGTNLFTHIRYMVFTTLPAWALTFIIFAVIGIFKSAYGMTPDTDYIRQHIGAQFNTSPWLLLAPAVLIIIIIKKIPAIPAMVVGILLGVLCALVFQSDLLGNLVAAGSFENRYQLLMQAVMGDMSLHTGVNEIDKLLSTSGMSGMLHTIFLIISAMIFGGMMDACGCLARITGALISLVVNRTSLVGSTLLTGIIFNITTCDQYLSIIISGKMWQNIYREKGYQPEVLSRALEDSSTVTSVLIPWNSCGATQAKVLGVATLDYLPYCFFNMLSPLVNLTLTALNIKIRMHKPL
ncbi:MAG: Na+/H+ antiporter NhaC [Prevotellaceae bacterium]|jgi:NhaC family Na+:H+ antiporter|nr:Na+/H+ antiporter NhaC [Prevotellaceae bacterium]